MTINKETDMSEEVEDKAGEIYGNCYEAIVVRPNGDRWDVYDGHDGPLVDTVDTAVLVELGESYDMPVRNGDGSYWDPPAGWNQKITNAGHRG